MLININYSREHHIIIWVISQAPMLDSWLDGQVIMSTCDAYQELHPRSDKYWNNNYKVHFKPATDSTEQLYGPPTACHKDHNIIMFQGIRTSMHLDATEY